MHSMKMDPRTKNSSHSNRMGKNKNNKFSLLLQKDGIVIGTVAMARSKEETGVMHLRSNVHIVVARFVNMEPLMMNQVQINGIVTGTAAMERSKEEIGVMHLRNNVHIVEEQFANMKILIMSQINHCGTVIGIVVMVKNKVAIGAMQSDSNVIIVEDKYVTGDLIDFNIQYSF